VLLDREFDQDVAVARLAREAVAEEPFSKQPPGFEPDVRRVLCVLPEPRDDLVAVSVDPDSPRVA
jgi:hypothetical protein